MLALQPLVRVQPKPCKRRRGAGVQRFSSGPVACVAGGEVQRSGMAKAAATKAKGRRTATRGQDRERVARVKLDSLPVGVWKETRSSYSPKVRAFVDGLVARGSSLADLYALQAARFAEMRELFDGAVAKLRLAEATGDKDGSATPGARTFALYDACMARTLAAMASLKLSMGPALDANDMPVRLPIGMTDPEMNAVLATLEDDEILS